MLKDFILISLLIAETYSLKKCYHQRCEINQGRYHLCDQENYNCTRWNETVDGNSTGHCTRYSGPPSSNSFIYCNCTDKCSDDLHLVPGQAVCEPEVGTGWMMLTIFFGLFVLVYNGSWVLFYWGFFSILKDKYYKIRRRRVRLQRKVKIKSKSTQTRLEAFPVTQLSTASYPPAQIKYASQSPSYSPPSYYTAAQYPAVPFPAAQYLGAEYPGSNTQCPPEYSGTMYHTSTQISQPNVQEPLVLTSLPGKIKKKRAKKTSTQTTSKNGPSAPDGRL